MGSPKDRDTKDRGIAPPLGWQWVNWIRVTHRPGTAIAEAFGVGGRRPRVAPLSITTAASLISEGVPVVLRRVDA